MRVTENEGIVVLGAEAKVTILKDTVIKERVRKRYRHKILDDTLRKERVKAEVKIMERLRSHGLKVPKILKYKDFVIKMERIRGVAFADLDHFPEHLVRELASYVAKMHNNNVIHGDLTLRNVILSKNEEIYLIDFGLSFISSRYEDKGTDLYVLEETSRNTTFPLDIFYEEYFSKVQNAGHIKSRLEKIRRRRRYLGSA